VERPYRGRGLGRALMEACIDWARQQPSLSWVDLGVFEGNDVAEALYRKLGFTELGRTPDRFRVDGLQITDITMVLQVDAT
jgi:ribosomal protein S18 acetylase RimI-like enzyme